VTSKKEKKKTEKKVCDKIKMATSNPVVMAIEDKILIKRLLLGD
jgi:hypothetical protein